MGGIKNLEAKKKANKVFSSGGGGGTKGPATVDKRSQEVKCPFCDKIYTQANSGRLKEHIASKHADQLAAQDGGSGAAGASSSAAAGAAAPPAAAAGAGAPAAAAAGGKGGVGAGGKGASAAAANPSAAAAAAALVRSATAAAAAAAVSKAHAPGAAVAAAAAAAGGGAAAASTTTTTTTTSTAGGGGGVMTINSRAGYYTSKAPSMHLHEWLQKEKRRGARYVPKKLENGLWTCMVVLPDPKRSEDDVVVWLGDAHAAEDEAEARERGAVAALHRVQGDRALERILPKDFVPLWGALGRERGEREAAAVEARRREEKRRKDEEARRRRAAQRGPQVVVMSSAKQALVQALLRERDAAARASGGAAAADGDGGDDDDALSEVVDQLTGMGFSPQHVQLAYERRTDDGGGGGVSVEALLDWLLLHLPSDQLPGRFTKGSSTNAVTVVARAADGVSLAAVARLMSYGYTSAECEAALRACGGGELAAHVRLYGGLTGVQLPATSGSDGGGGGEAWAEELAVLESMYDDQFAVLSERAVRLSLPLPDDCAVATRQDAPLVVELTRLGGGGGGADADGGGGGGSSLPPYPDVPPLVAVSCAGLAAGALRHLTRVLAEESQQLLGQPALIALAMRAAEAAAALDAAAVAAAEPGAASAAGGAAAAGAGGLERQGSSLVDGFEGLVVEDEEDSDEEAEAVKAAARGRAPPPRRPAAALHRGRPRIDIAAESARLSRLQHDLATSTSHEAMRVRRAALPAYGKRSEVLAALAAHDVLVVSGATGCGKSTQVPQYILEEAIAAGRGAACNIVVTQPRRISALGLASRVASERGERVGEVVGYSVRLDHRSSAATRLTFVTSGILLRRLLSDPELEGTTHVVLDEVHERSIEIDLLLLLLRDVLAARAAKRAAVQGGDRGTAPPPLKLVLMSATADAQLFADYMAVGAAAGASAAGAASAAGGGGGGGGRGGKGGRGGGAHATAHAAAAAAAAAGGTGVATLTIPGFTYPVREFYLEDALELTGLVIGRDSRYAKKGPKGKAAGGGGGGRGARGEGAEGGGGAPPAEDWEAAAEAEARRGPGLSGALPRYSDATMRSLGNVDEDQVNYDLLVEVVAHVVASHRRHGADAYMTDWPEAFTSGRGDASGGGAVLVFLPGAPEISRAQRMLLASDRVLGAAGGRGGLRVLPLHGSLSSGDQAKVFARPPPGVTKVVLATNVAETSITIDDVTVVVDCGRAKEMSHDAERGILRLQEGWVSRAAAQQRRGRAGRVRPGVCFRLFSSEQWARMAPHTQPEMLRSPLESTCLLVKGMATAATPPAATPPTATPPATSTSSSSVADFLARCLSPPPPRAVQSAVRLLQAIGAFDGGEGLTSLGRHLGRMPMDPRVGKALVYGALLGCLDPVLTVTAAMAHGRPVFLNTQSAGEGVEAARRALLGPARAVRSDHVALLGAYNAWCRALDKGGRAAGSQLAADTGLSESSLEAIAAGRAEYAGVLSELGLLDLPPEAAPRDAAAPGAPLPGSAWLGASANRHAANSRFLKAALCAGFYPALLRVQHPAAKFVAVHGGTAEAEADPKDVKLFDRERGRVFVHPGSVCFDVGKYDSGWLVYTQMTETSKLFVREVSMAPVYAVLLFGGELAVEHGTGLLRVDGWAEFKASAQVGVMVRELRAEMDRLLGAKIDNPSLQLAGNKLVAAVEQLLSTDGF